MKISASSCWVWKNLVLLQLQQPEFDLLLSFFIIASNNKNKDAKKKKKTKKDLSTKPNPKKQKNKIGKSEAGYYFRTNKRIQNKTKVLHQGITELEHTLYCCSSSLPT
jgi:hypothetical protein